MVTKPADEGATSEKDTGLALVVSGELRNETVLGAEMDSKRLDLHWGSFRAGMKVSDVNGTCAAFFWVSPSSPFVA